MRLKQTCGLITSKILPKYIHLIIFIITCTYHIRNIIILCPNSDNP